MCLPKLRAPLRIVRFMLPIVPCLFLTTPPTLCQDSGSEGTLFRGDKAEISVTVRDSSGEPISAPASVKIFKEGMPTDQREASRGRAFFILRSLGDYTLVVNATGYKIAQKDVSVPVAVRAEVEIYLQKAAQMDPSNAHVLGALGMALTDQGKYEAAIAPLEKSLQLEAAGGWETHWALGKAYYYRQRYDQALKISQLALTESNGKAPQIELLVAQSLTAVGRYDDAAQTLREFLKSHGDSPEAATARRWLEGLAKNGKIR